MKLKNKIILSIGTTASVVAPIATVVSCGSTPETPQTAIEQRELWAKAQNAIETKYQEMLISQISETNTQFNNSGTTKIEEKDFQDYKNAAFPAAVKNEIKQMFIKSIYSTPTYLNNFGNKLVHMIDPSTIDPNKPGDEGKLFEYNDLTNDGFYDMYLPNMVLNAAAINKINALIDKYMPVIWNNNVANFKNVMYQYIISDYYLDTNKDNWSEVFTKPAGATGKITGIEGNIDPTEFVLSQKVVRAKLAFTWDVALSDTASKAYVGKSKTEAELNSSLSPFSAPTTANPTGRPEGEIFKDETLTQKRSFIPEFLYDKASLATANSIWRLVDESKEISGFAGIVDKSAFASSEAKIKQVTGSDATEIYKMYDKNYEGFVDKAKSEVIDNQDIKLTTPANSKVDLEKILMIMPSYVNGQLKLESLKDADGSYKTLKSILLFKQEQDIYKEAITYYSSKDNHEFKWDADKKEGGIRLTILDESLRKVALDTFGLDYVNKDN